MEPNSIPIKWSSTPKTSEMLRLSQALKVDRLMPDKHNAPGEVRTPERLAQRPIRRLSLFLTLQSENRLLLIFFCKPVRCHESFKIRDLR